jgi:hypothetical protein
MQASPYGTSRRINTTVAQLEGPAWQTLLERCGDAIMLHLLKHASLFAPLPSDCLLQLSGTPVVEVFLISASSLRALSPLNPAGSNVS